METKQDVYEVFRFASWDRLHEAYGAGDLTTKQVRVLLARKGYDPKQVRLILKGWA